MSADQRPRNVAASPEGGHARLHVLAAVSHAFATVVTDYRQLLQNIARTTADLVGDGCLVTLVSDDGETLHNAASAHRQASLDADYRTYLTGVGLSRTTSQLSRRGCRIERV